MSSSFYRQQNTRIVSRGQRQRMSMSCVDNDCSLLYDIMSTGYPHPMAALLPPDKVPCRTFSPIGQYCPVTLYWHNRIPRAVAALKPCGEFGWGHVLYGQSGIANIHGLKTHLFWTARHAEMFYAISAPNIKYTDWSTDLLTVVFVLTMARLFVFVNARARFLLLDFDV